MKVPTRQIKKTSRIPVQTIISLPTNHKTMKTLQIAAIILINLIILSVTICPVCANTSASTSATNGIIPTLNITNIADKQKFPDYPYFPYVTDITNLTVSTHLQNPTALNLGKGELIEHIKSTPPPPDPSKNTIPAIISAYNDISTTTTEIILNTAGSTPPPAINYQQHTTTINQALKSFNKSGFILLGTNTESIDTTDIYENFKTSLTNTATLPNINSVNTNVHTYLLHNPHTNALSTLRLFYLSTENNAIIGHPIITENQIISTKSNTKSKTKPHQSSLLPNTPPANLANQNEPPNTQTNPLETAFITYEANTNKPHTNHLLTYDSKSTFTNIKQSHLKPSTEIATGTNTQKKQTPNQTNYHFQQQTHYIKNVVKVIGAIVVGSIIIIIAPEKGYIAAIKNIPAVTALIATSVILSTIQTIPIYNSQNHEYYPINSQKELIDNIAITPSNYTDTQIPIPYYSSVTLNNYGSCIVHTPYSTLERIWSPLTTADVLHFDNINTTHPHTVYKIPFNITVPNDAHVTIGADTAIGVIQNGDFIALIKQPENAHVDFIVQRENGDILAQRSW